MIIDKREQFLLFDFLTFIGLKLNIKIDYLELIQEYEESRKGKYQ